MQGLTDEQIVELHLKDEFEDVCVPSGGFVLAKDPLGRRNGRGGVLKIPLSHDFIVAMSHFSASDEKMKDVLKRTISEAKAAVSKVPMFVRIQYLDCTKRLLQK